MRSKLSLLPACANHCWRSAVTLSRSSAGSRRRRSHCAVLQAIPNDALESFMDRCRRTSAVATTMVVAAVVAMVMAARNRRCANGAATNAGDNTEAGEIAGRSRAANGSAGRGAASRSGAKADRTTAGAVSHPTTVTPRPRPRPRFRPRAPCRPPARTRPRRPQNGRT